MGNLPQVLGLCLVDETELRPETGRCDLVFAEHNESALEKLSHGDLGELLHFINWCFVQRRDVPAWAQERLNEAVTKVVEYDVKSWDEVFSQPLKKGRQLAAARRHRTEVAAEVWKRANERRRTGESVDSAFFAAIGRELGIGGATVMSDIYYAIMRQFEERGGTGDDNVPVGPTRRATMTCIAKFEPPFDPQYDGPPRAWLIVMR